MDRIKKLNVYYHQRKVGTLALYQKMLNVFEYDKEWLVDGFSISPFSLPLKQTVFIPKQNAAEEKEERWVLSPAYDLTYSYSIGGEHATMVNGEGQNPGMEDVLAVAKEIGIKKTRARAIAEEIRECTAEMLQVYL